MIEKQAGRLEGRVAIVIDSTRTSAALFRGFRQEGAAVVIDGHNDRGKVKDIVRTISETVEQAPQYDGAGVDAWFGQAIAREYSVQRVTCNTAFSGAMATAGDMNPCAHIACERLMGQLAIVWKSPGASPRPASTGGATRASSSPASPCP